MSNRINDKTRALRWGLVGFFLLLELGLVAWGIKGSIIPEEIREVPGYAEWRPEIVDEAAMIPVQDGGRIKPFFTLARFKMLSFHGSLSMKVEAGERKIKIGPTEWLLDCLFRRELAHDLPVFRVDDSEVLHRFGIIPKDRRARLSYKDFTKDYGKGAGGRDRLREAVRGILEKEEREKQRRARMTPKQIKNEKYSRNDDEIEEEKRMKIESRALKDLEGKLRDYESLTQFLDFARADLDPPEIPESVFSSDGLDPNLFSTWLNRFGRLRLIMSMAAQQGSQTPPEIEELLRDIFELMNRTRGGVKWLPPREKTDEEWPSVGNQIIATLENQSFDWDRVNDNMKALEALQAEGAEIPKRLDDVARWKGILEDMARLEKLVAAAKKPKSDRFLEEITSWKEEVIKRAEVREEGGEIEGEVSYYQRNYFMRALGFFLIAFVLSAIGWLVSEGNFATGLKWGTAGLYTIAFLMLIAGIAHRSFLMDRPPVGNLYDTIPFITMGATLVLGVGEWLTRRGLLISLGSVLGVVGLFLAFRYEAGNADDHMDPLVAVLKSNYWLATHVVTVVIGYSGGLMACFLSAVYVHIRLAGLSTDEQSFRRFMTRAVYGVICFTLLFSLVGTVLGGIWANDSWGRFWGWDPKENGALLIVIWSLIILHGRLAGWLRDWGIHLCAIFGGAVVGFSWWHVNMLEVGLHSYGFIDGGEVIWLYYLACLIAFLVGVAAWYVDRLQKPQLKESKPPSIPPEA